MIEISKSSQKYQFSNFPPNSIFTNEFFRQHFLLEIASVIDEIGHFRVKIGNVSVEIGNFYKIVPQNRQFKRSNRMRS